MNIHAILPFISSLIFLTNGLVVYLFNKENVKNSFLRFCYFTFHWQFSWFIMFSIGNENNAMFLVRIGYSGIIFIPAAFYESMCSYLNIKTIATRTLYLISFLFLIFLWTTNQFMSGYYKASFGYYPKAGFLHLLYLILVLYVFVYSIKALTQKIKDKSDTKNHLILFYYGLIVYSAAAMDYMLNYPVLINTLGIHLYPFGVVFIIFSLFLFLLAHKSRINQFLEYQIEERTMELKKSLALLKRVQKAKKEFIASITHDFKNPLSVISGYAMILENKLIPGTKEFKAVENISLSVNQIARLLDSLIQVSLLESDKLKPDLDTYNYSLFVQDYLKQFENSAVSNDIELSWKYTKERIIVKADILWLERILGNLIQNAFKYVGNNGSIDVKVYTDQEYVYTEVNDTGIGIPEDKLDLIFVRKYQAHKDLKKEGYGLGLSIVKEMLEIIGGTITVESKKEVGTRFTYSLPLYTDQNKIAKNETSYSTNIVERRSGLDRRKESRIKKLVTEIDENIKLDTLKKKLTQYEMNKKNDKNILICDDNPSHLQLLAEKLCDNYNLLLAENGEAGLQKLSLYNAAIDAILTDVEMPVMNGMILCRKIKETEKFKNIPVIMMSSFCNDTDKSHAFKSGAHCYIEKNKEKEDIVKIINSIIHQ